MEKLNKKEEKFLISACLLGIGCRYDGKRKPHKLALRLYKKGLAIPVCPEQLGGLSTPRLASGITDGKGRHVLEGKSRVVNEKGEDVTKQFLKGAKEALKIARLSRVDKFIAKSKSPSCGLGSTYRGNFKEGKFSNIQTKGDGVTVALFKKSGIGVITENDLA
jgi:uncharacterized protein YbbK (DUF523 family)